MNTVFVCGAGHQGLSMAAHLALTGNNVNLWNRTALHIKKVKETKTIYCDGIIKGAAGIQAVSDEIKDVITELVMVTTPSTAHRDIAKRIAPYVTENMIVVLNPGRSFGAIEFAQELKNAGVERLPHIAETQTIVYTCRKRAEDAVTIFALKDKVKIASLQRNDLSKIIGSFPNAIRKHFIQSSSVIETSLSNVGMILHCAPVLMNIGWIESEKVDFKYYYDGISKSIAQFLEEMDNERLMVSYKMGYSILSVKSWLQEAYGVQGRDLYECLRNTASYREIDAPDTINTRYLLEDVPNGLVPIEYLGHQLGISVPHITTIINLAEQVLKQNFRRDGRCFDYQFLKSMACE